MKTIENFRSRVMKYAWQIFKATKDMWSSCLRKAWRIWRLIRKMREGAVMFYYYKADGTLRKAIGTLNDLGESKKGRKPNYKTVSYFDLSKRAFRCFKVENLLCIA